MGSDRERNLHSDRSNSRLVSTQQEAADLPPPQDLAGLLQTSGAVAKLGMLQGLWSREARLALKGKERIAEAQAKIDEINRLLAGP